MSGRKRYRKKPNQFVTAVRLDLDLTPSGGAIYFQKWGSKQRCKPGDWIVDNEGDVYTVDADVFARTYRQLSPGVYLKTTPIWAEVARENDVVETKEGKSEYTAGDYLVWNEEDGGDAYCIGKAKFERMYERDE